MGYFQIAQAITKLNVNLSIASSPKSFLNGNVFNINQRNVLR